MAIKMKRLHRKVNAADLARFEAKIGQTLPGDYRQFLLESNGGRPEGNTFDVPEDDNRSEVTLFFGLRRSEKSGDLRYERSLMRDRVPEDMLPIGSDCCGNLLCLSLRLDTRGQVFFWDHELEGDEGEPPTFSNLFKVGDSFKEFFDSLKPFNPEDVESEPCEGVSVWIHPDFQKLVKKAEEDAKD
jgi:hypothetical protein